MHSRKSPPPPAAPSQRLTAHRPARPDETPGKASQATFNDAESPLSWLRSRKDKCGKALLSNEQYLAGEKLRIDFERAMLQRRVTQNWDVASAGRRGGNITAELSDGALAARQRHQKALDAVGPELSSILLQVCCLSAGIEQAERLLDLPQRSGKAVLGLALTSLARHYGLLKEQRRGAEGGTTVQWSLADSRPRIQVAEDA